MKERIQNRWRQIQAFRERHATAELAVFFAAGFLVDVLMLKRIDHWPAIIKQGVYLSVLGVLLVLERLPELKRGLPTWAHKALSFSESAIHFLFGNLLSAFTLFYFKSASGLVALSFMVVLFGLLIANELPRFRKLGPLVRFGLYGFCLTSFFAYFYPVLLGHLSPKLFWMACASSATVMALLYVLLRSFGQGSWPAVRLVALPGLLVQALLLGLYTYRVIPPVPLAVQFIGIYHSVERKGGDYELSHLRPKWKFWQHGDQDFDARKGDKIYCFVRIFAPTKFQDRVLLRWSYLDPKAGWRDWDAVPLTVSGGRDAGYRGYAFKARYQPGRWQVKVETEDGRGLGSITFDVVADDSREERVFNVDVV